MILAEQELIGKDTKWNKIVITNTDDRLLGSVFENYHIFSRVPTKMTRCLFEDTMDATDVTQIPFPTVPTPMAIIEECVFTNCVFGGQFLIEQNYFKPKSEFTTNPDKEVK